MHVLNQTGRQPDTTTHRDPATRLLHAVRSAQRGGADRVRHYATLALYPSYRAHPKEDRPPERDERMQTGGETISMAGWPVYTTCTQL